MKYCSTRGGVTGVSFEEAISSGYAADGGLFVPEALPRLTPETLQSWRGLDFRGLSEAVLSLFVGGEVGAADLRRIVDRCYSGFSSPGVVPVRRLGQLFVAELFHGPTFCFKDLGQQPLVLLLAHFAERRRQRRTMLVSTTGDTGPAAMRAVSDSGSPNLDIIVFYPEGQISELQRRQMTTRASERARVAAFEGGGDDMDLPLKRLAADRAFAARHGLCGINSYNLGRPVAQMAHYFWTYFRVLDGLGLGTGAPLDMALPGGALGNLAAGLMARHMGLPVRRFVVGVNANDITHRTFARGEFHRGERMEKTLSDAINIQVPYNMERLFYYLTGEDPGLVAGWMAEVERSGRLTLPQRWLAELQRVYSSYRVDDAAMCAALRGTLEAHGYLADPHGAVALAAAGAHHREAAAAGGTPLAVLLTASPCKFQNAITEAVGPERWAAYANSAAFPPAARALLAAPEYPFETLRRAGPLPDTQLAWEAAVRQALGGDGGRSAPAAAKL